MTSRRKFLEKSLASSILLSPLAHMTKASARELNELVYSGDEKEYWKAVRAQFSMKSDQTYFNNGTMGPVPDFTLNRMIDDMRYNAIHGAETDYKGEGPEILSGYFPYEERRKKVAALINADWQEVALIQNATFGMNYVANGLDLKPGDELLNTNQEHGGGFAAWQMLAERKGCVYKQAVMPVPANDPEEIFEAVFKEVTPRTRIIAIPHIVSVYGVVMPVKEICAEARKRGIFTVLDGAQTVGQIKVDVQDIGCDAYYSSLHKWLLAPAGNGLLYIRADRMPEIWSTIASYNWKNDKDHGFRLMQNGTGNPSLLVGLDASIAFYHTIGAERWVNRIKYLGDYLRNQLVSIDKVTIYSSSHADMCAGITTYAIEGMTGPQLQKTLWERERLQPRSVGKEYLRHSVHIYNNEDEIDRTIKVLRTL